MSWKTRILKIWIFIVILQYPSVLLWEELGTLILRSSINEWLAPLLEPEPEFLNQPPPDFEDTS